MPRQLPLAAALILAPVLAPAAATAAVVGAPVFTTAPADISVVNEFGFAGPSNEVTLNVTTTISSAIGAPDLVGETLSFGLRFDAEIAPGVGNPVEPGRLVIGGTDIFVTTGADPYQVVVLPPLAVDSPAPDEPWTYSGIFAAFGPRMGEYPERLLEWALDRPIPTQIYRVYCFVADPSDCQPVERDGAAPLTEIAGMAVTVLEELTYFEGTIEDATITFSTVGGRPVDPAPVPLPAAALLLGGALAGLGALRRR